VHAAADHREIKYRGSKPFNELRKLAPAIGTCAVSYCVGAEFDAYTVLNGHCMEALVLKLETFARATHTDAHSAPPSPASSPSFLLQRQV
jgi:hypothetical protein